MEFIFSAKTISIRYITSRDDCDRIHIQLKYFEKIQIHPKQEIDKTHLTWFGYRWKRVSVTYYTWRSSPHINIYLHKTTYPVIPKQTYNRHLDRSIGRRKQENHKGKSWKFGTPPASQKILHEPKFKDNSIYLKLYILYWSE